jgi:hypothetical protein
MPGGIGLSTPCGLSMAQHDGVAAIGIVTGAGAAFVVGAIIIVLRMIKSKF